MGLPGSGREGKSQQVHVGGEGQRTSGGMLPGKTEASLLPKQVCLGENDIVRRFSVWSESSRRC